MKTLTQNTISDTPSFADNTQLESTDIRELSQDEIELVSAADIGDATVAGAIAGAVGGAKWGAQFGKFGGPAGLVAGVVIGGAVGYAVYKIANRDKKEEEDLCKCDCACGI